MKKQSHSFISHHPRGTAHTQNRTIHIKLWSEAGLFLLVVIAVIVPAWRQLHLLAADWNETRAQTLVLERAAQDRQHVQTDIGAFQEQTLLEAALPTENQVIQYIESIEQVASTTSVDARLTFHTSKRVVRQGAIVIPLTMTLTGSFEHTLQFLATLEEQPSYLTPTALRYSKQSVDDSTVVVSIDAESFWSL